MWYLIFLFSTIMNILSFIYPFLVKLDLSINILRLKGKIKITIFNKIKLEFKFRVKNNYVYIYFKKKEFKEKISASNKNVIFIFTLINQLYFRQQYLDLGLTSNFGYINNSCITAVSSGYIDVLTKCVFAKIKNNKKSAHIFVNIEPKYNEDVFNVRITNTFRISVLDIFYVLFYTRIYSWRSYEKNRKRKFKQG